MAPVSTVVCVFLPRSASWMQAQRRRLGFPQGWVLLSEYDKLREKQEGGEYIQEGVYNDRSWHLNRMREASMGRG